MRVDVLSVKSDERRIATFDCCRGVLELDDVSKSLISSLLIIFILWFDCKNDEGPKGFWLVSSQDWKRGGGVDD